MSASSRPIPTGYSDDPVPATLDTINKTVEFIGDKRSGGTELGIALEQALSQKKDLRRRLKTGPYYYGCRSYGSWPDPPPRGLGAETRGCPPDQHPLH